MKPRILIVDDEVSTTETLQGFLHKKGYDVTTEQDPEHALQLVKDRGFDLIIADYRMPKMNGLELIQRSERSTLLLQSLPFQPMAILKPQ